MGISGSKLAHRATENSTTDEKGSIPSTPILTPKVFRETLEKENLDPRSPSKHIARTPVDLLSAASDKLSNLVIETGDSDKLAVETPSKGHLILGIDPRSPSLEVQRTPIIVSVSSNNELPAQIKNKHLEKVKNSVLLGTPKAVPPKLLDSNPVTPKPQADPYKRKSFVFLETNIDFTETDLDSVIKEKYLGKSLQDLLAAEESHFCEILDPRSPTIDFLRTPIQICKTADSLIDELESKPIKAVEELMAKDVGNDIVINKEQVESTSVSSECAEVILPETEVECLVNLVLNEESTEEGNVENTCQLMPSHSQVSNEENIEDQLNGSSPVEDQDKTSNSDLQIENTNDIPIIIPKSAPVSPPSTIITLTPKKCKSQPITPPIMDLTADVKELDKKLTNLIYEDEDLMDCPRTVKAKDQSRTPLGLRNGTHNLKPTQKLKVSDKPRKLDFAVSKIPVFKEKKIKVQCENTPPRGMRAGKSKKSQWDPKDDTLVI